MKHSIDLTPFTRAVSTKTERLRKTAEGRKIFGWFCTYTPIEMIHAAGFLPVRISGGTVRIRNANNLVPTFICPYMRASLERALGGEYDYLSGVIQGYTCDVACGMVNIWAENIKGELYHTIPLPYNTSDESRIFYRKTLDELTEKLVSVGVRVDDASLGASLDLFRDIRTSMRELYDLRSLNRLPLSAREFYAVVEAGFSLPPEEYRQLLAVLLETLGGGIEEGPRGIPVLVSGSLVEEPTVYDVLEASGGRVAADDLCTGYRFIDPPDGTGPDPIGRLIDRYQRRFPCPSRSTAADRISPIKGLISGSGARGVIFLFQKFCTPHLSDYPVMVEELRKEGIPTLLVEMEETGLGEGQLKTRLEGFFEMIGD
jgi:benzoyl-CoA reductase/2-hydroxyglutaryl-CoA dehydratase subunit BcrC/BadD/HgdB